MSASSRSSFVSKNDKYGKYRKREEKRRARTVRTLSSPLPPNFDVEEGKRLGKRARHANGDFVVKRACTSAEQAALCLLRQHLLGEVFLCRDTPKGGELTLLLRSRGESFVSLRAYVTAKPFGQWLTKKVSFTLLYDTSMQAFVCKVFVGVFVRHIIGLSDENGRALSRHILIAQRPRRIVHISLDGPDDTRNAIDTYLDERATVFDLLRCARWPRELREAFARLCRTAQCRMRMLRALNDMSEQGVWHTVYDFVERYGMFTKVNVLAMQARLYQLRTALQKQNIS